MSVKNKSILITGGMWLGQNRAMGGMHKDGRGAKTRRPSGPGHGQGQGVVPPGQAQEKAVKLRTLRQVRIHGAQIKAHIIIIRSR